MPTAKALQDAVIAQAQAPAATEIARLQERDAAILRELELLRGEVARIEGRLWMVAIGGLGAGALGGAGGALVQVLFGG